MMMPWMKRAGAMLLLVLAGFALNASAEDFPAQIKDLEPLYAKQDEFVAGVRDWAKQQLDSAEVNLGEAKQLARSRKPEEAKAKKAVAEAAVNSVRDVYEFALKKYDQDAKLHNAYGELLYDQFGETPGALRQWELAMSLDAKYAPPYNNLGLDQCHSGKYDIGITNLEKALDLDPKNPDFMFNIAQIYLVNFPQVEKIKGWKPKKVYERAMSLSKTATELQPDDYQLAEDYAMNFFAAENFQIEPDWADAAAAWARARGATKRSDRVFNAWLNEARCWIQGANPESARPCLEEALKIIPDNAVAKQLLENLSNPALLKPTAAEQQKKDEGSGKKSKKGKQIEREMKKEESGNNLKPRSGRSF